LILCSFVLLANSTIDYVDYDEDDYEETLPEPEDDVEMSAKVVHTHHTEMTRLHAFIKENAGSNKYPPRTPITIHFSVISGENIYLDEHSQTLSAKIRMCSYYIDNRLKWNRTEFNDTKHITVPRWDVWTPDFQPLNGINKPVD
ncbi:hypothetical protein PFISCL1PPCAC_20910, partial [Pristionchus fissidentatus]